MSLSKKQDSAFKSPEKIGKRVTDRVQEESTKEFDIFSVGVKNRKRVINVGSAINPLTN